MTQLDPALLIGFGALVMLTLVLMVALGIGVAIGSWLLRHVSGFDDLSARREDGKVKLGGTLVDSARPGRARKKSAEPRTVNELVRRTSKGQPS